MQIQQVVAQFLAAAPFFNKNQEETSTSNEVAASSGAVVADAEAEFVQVDAYNKVVISNTSNGTNDTSSNAGAAVVGANGAVLGAAVVGLAAVLL
jgi:hypothetical protein